MSHIERIEDVVRQWIVDITQLPPDRVVWGAQTIGPRPAGSPVALSVLLNPLPQESDDWVTAERRIFEYPSRGWTVDGDDLLVPGHGLEHGDGPFALTGTVAGQFWVIFVDEDRIRIADTFQDARVDNGITLPGVGTGTIEGAARTVRAAAPAEQVVTGTRLLELEIQARGGPPTGSGQAWVLLDELATSTTFDEVVERFLSADLAFGSTGDVVAIRGQVVNKIYQEPYARWTCEISYGVRAARPAYVIEQVEINVDVI